MGRLTATAIGAGGLEYDDLVTEPGGGDPFDRHVFACVLARAWDASRPLAEGLGLDGAAMAEMVARYFPAAAIRLGGPSFSSGDDPLALEEPDLRALLLDYRRSDAAETGWMAHVIARRSLESGHLWEDLGLRSRLELCELMERHFPGLAAANDRNMKWKKFFYRTLCQRDGLVVCKSPNCEVCSDFALCFGPEE